MQNIGSLFIYLFIFFISEYLFFKSKKKIGLKIIILLLILAIFASIRENVGTDFSSYIELYHKVESGIRNIYNTNWEYGFFLIMKLAVIMREPKSIFFFSTILGVFIICKAIKENKDLKHKDVAFFGFLCVYFPLSFNIVRQWIALCIVFYSYKYINKKNFFRFFLFILIASIFHKTALFCLIVYPIHYYVLKLKNSKTINSRIILMILILLSVLVTSYFFDIIDYLTRFNFLSKYIIYNKETMIGNNREFYLKVLVFCSLTVILPKMLKKSNKNLLYIVCLYIEVLMIYLGFTNIYIKRLGLYFGITQLFYVPNVPEIFKKKTRKIIKILILFYYLLLFLIMYFFLNQGEIFPYKIA